MEAGDLVEVSDAIAVDVEVEVDEIECLEDVGNAAAAVEVEGAVEDDVFGTEGIGGGDEADHAVGDGDAEVMRRVDAVGVDGPGVLCLGRRLGNREEDEKKSPTESCGADDHSCNFCNRQRLIYQLLSILNFL